ncbi:hypothetical protein Sam46_gp71 [Bacillus phage vB_BcM_Sam46]|uniref:Uncharacterized protein n=2 Tax=Caudoviricetes TaxID=2731619 RepID=A0A6G9L9N2_9CAUD|nr:hypothetical protein Sam112_gp69 [Bacillus phage vB_BcM_Sam112]QIQ61272.1 hypothetical protein Sam46_gp71 [Bacillus phage vB_BcM_Sam46]
MKLTPEQIKAIQELCERCDWSQEKAVDDTLEILGVYNQVFGEAE